MPSIQYEHSMYINIYTVNMTQNLWFLTLLLSAWNNKFGARFRNLLEKDWLYHEMALIQVQKQNIASLMVSQIIDPGVQKSTRTSFANDK